MTPDTVDQTAGETRWRKKPVVIDAVQFTGFNVVECVRFMGHEPMLGASEPHETLFIDTLEGRMSASRGDWIIRGVKGEYYPCKPDIFAATYEPAGSRSAGYPAPASLAERETFAAELERDGLTPDEASKVAGSRSAPEDVTDAPTPKEIAQASETIWREWNGGEGADTIAGLVLEQFVKGRDTRSGQRTSDSTETR